MNRNVGVGAAVGSAVLFGLSTPIAKGMLATVPPHMLGGLFYLGSGLGLAVLCLGRDLTSKGVRTPIGGRQAAWLGAAILCGGILAPPLQLIGVQRTPSSLASLLLNFESVFTAMLAWIVFREHVNARTAVGMACVVCGGILLSWGDSREGGGVSGPLAISAACFLWGLDNNFTQKVSGQDPMRIAALKGLVSGVVNCSAAVAAGAAIPGPTRLACALVLGFLSYGLSLVLFIQALRALGTARTGAYFSLAPFVGAFAGIALWNESVSARFVAATVLMGFGLWLHLTEQHEHSHDHGEEFHSHEHIHDDHHQHDHGPGDSPGEPHVHPHRHVPMTHSHPHFPDLDHRHSHGNGQG